MPFVTMAYIVICCVLYYAVPDPRPFLTTPFLLVHDFSLVHLGQALAAGFFHHDFSHIAGNLVLLTLAGFPVERRLGSGKMAMLVLIAGLGSLVAHVGSDPESTNYFLGASGVLFGVIAAHAATC